MTNKLQFARNLQIFTITKIASAPRCYCFCLRIRITSQEKNIDFANLSFSPFFKCPTTFPNFRLQTAYLSTRLFVSYASWLSPISEVLYIRSDVDNASFWLSRWWRENAKKSIREWEMYEMLLLKKSSNFTLPTFLSCNTFSF